MSNTNNLENIGFEVKGNLTVVSDNCNGDGSVELAGTLYTDNILKYTTTEPGVFIEQSIFNAGKVTIVSTAPGINLSSASLVVAGGIAVASDSKLYGQLIICNTTNSTTTTDGALVVIGGAFIKQNLNIGNEGTLTLYNTTSSSDISSGSLITLGGILVQNTVDATSFTSGGALTLAGGASIYKTLFANLLQTNTATIGSLNNSSFTSNNASIANLNSQSGTVQNLFTLNLQSSSAILLNSTISNLNLNSENVVNSNISNLNTNLLTVNQETIGSSNILSANISTLNLTSGNFESITVGSIFVTNDLVYNDIVTNLSSANTISQSATISNLNITNGTFGSLYGNSGSLIYSDYVSAANLQATNLYVTTIATIANLIAVKETVGSIFVSYSTIGNIINTNLVNTNLTNSNLISTNLTSTNLVNSNLSTGNLNVISASIGNLIITSTTPSCNPTSAALILAGGIYINETKDAISITTGGGLTVLGGVSIVKNVYIGNTVNVSTISTGSLYSNNSWITYSNFTKITSSSLILTNTCDSYLETGGALISYGGITINNTADAVACSYGGALTVAGGASINKTLMVCGTVSATSISTSNIFVAESLITGSLNTANILTTNVTTDALISNIGTIGNLKNTNLNSVSISTSNLLATNETVSNLTAVNIASTNALLTNISYGNLIGNYLSANYITNNILLSSNNATIATLNTNNATLGNINFAYGTYGSLYGSYLEAYTGTINTLLSTHSTTTNLYAPTSTLGNVLATNICTGTLNTSSANISVASVGNLNVMNLITTNLTISNPNVNFITAGSLNATNATVSNALIDFLTFLYASFGNLSGSNGSFVNISNNSLITINSTTTNAYITNSTITNIYTLDFNSLYGTISNLISTNGSFSNLSSGNLITINELVTNSSITNSITQNATISNLYLTVGTFGSLVGGNIGAVGSTFTNSIITNLTSAFLVNTSSSIGTLNLGALTAGNINFTGTLYQNGAPYIASQWTSISQNIAYTVGNVGINTTAPTRTLDVNGTLYISSFATLGNLYTPYATIGNINSNSIFSTFSDLVNVYNTNLTSTNILATNETIASGIITNLTTNNLYSNIASVVNLNSTSSTFGTITISGTSPSYNSTTATLILQSGGISINCTVNATSITSGGGETIAGGLAVYKDTYVGGNIYLDNGIITNVTAPNVDSDVANKWYVDNRFFNFTVGNVNGNFTQGQVIIATTAGNITGYPTFTFDSFTNSLTLYGTVDATSLTDGGTLTIFGGASIDKQLYVGGNTHILGYLDVNNQKITSVATCTTPYDAANKYYVDSRFNAFTIGNVSGNFTQGQVIIASIGGNITSYPTFTFDGTLLSILSTSNSIGYGSGGSLNVGGGISIGGNAYLNNSVITGVTAPSVNLDVANKWYVDNRFNAFTIGNVSGNFTQGQVIIASTGGNITSYPTFTYDGSLLNILTTSNSIGYGSGGSLNIGGGVSIGGNVYLNSGIITNVTAPSNSLDVANKWYVDQHVSTTGSIYGNFTQGQVIVAGTSGSILGYTNFTFDGNLLSILSTADSVGLGSGGSLTINGGGSIAKILYTNGINNNDQIISNVNYPVMPLDAVNKAYVDFYLGISTGDIPEKSFVLANNVTTPQDVTGFLFENAYCSSFQGIVYLQIPGLNIYDRWELSGVLKGTQWKLNTKFIGDYPSNVNFSISSNGTLGQIQYTNLNSTGTATIVFRANTTGYGTFTNVTLSNYMNTVPNGGTGTSYFTSGTLLFGNGSGPISTDINLLYTSGSLILGNTALATSLTSGGVFNVSGGVIIKQNLLVGNGADFNNKVITNVTAPSNLLDVANKWYVDQVMSSGGSINSNGPVSFSSTLDATSVSNGGALTIFGGTSIAKSFYVGGIAHFVNSTASTNTSSGSVVVSGGLGVSGTINGTNALFTNETVTNSLIINATLGSINVTSLTTSNLNSLSGIYTNLFTTNFTSTNNIFTNVSSSSLLASNFSSANGIITNLNSTNSTTTNALITTLTTSNVIGINITTTNLTSSNLVTTNITSSNSNVTNLTVGNEVAINISSASLSSSLGVISNLTVGNEFITNETVINLLATNISSTNGIYTNLTAGTLSTINLNLTNITASNGLITSLTVGNEVLTNETVTNLISTNHLTSTFTSGNAIIQNNITTKNVLITGTTNANNILTIDCFASQTFGGQILFKNSSGTGDYRIFGDGGDVQWLGGGGRAMQFGAYHQVIISGGRTSTVSIPQLNGNGATYNTIIQNSNNSIALQVRSNTTQTVNLQEWNNSTGSLVLSRVNNLGEIGINSTKDYSNATTGSLTTLGGVGISKSLFVSNVNMTPSQGDLFFEQSFSAANGVLAAANVTGFAFTNATVRFFRAWGSVTITATTNKISGFELLGIQTSTGWKVNSTFVGDNTGIVFSISNTGQVQYTSTNTIGFISCIIKFRALTTSVV
jgi:hypothetical protein